MRTEQMELGTMQVNCYIVWDPDIKKAYVIDPGDCADKVYDRLNELGLSCGDSGDSRFTCTVCGREDKSLRTQIENQDEANIVKEMIENLPDPDSISLKDKGDVEVARTAYDELSDRAKELIPSELKEKLEAIEEKIKALEEAQEEAQEEANIVIEMIKNLPNPDSITLKDKGDVEAARNAYDQLSDPAKELIPQELKEKLEAIEEKIKALEEALIEKRTINYKLKNVKVKAKKNKVVITWGKILRKTKNQKKIYKQIQYICIEVSTDSNFNNIIKTKKVGKKKTKTTITGLKEKTNYWVRIYVANSEGISKYVVKRVKTKKK